MWTVENSNYQEYARLNVSNVQLFTNVGVHFIYMFPFILVFELTNNGYEPNVPISVL